MKYFKNIFIASALVLAATSCVNDDVNYSETVKPIVSVTGQSQGSIMEGEKITISLATNTQYKEEMDFKLELVSGGQDADYFVSDADGVATGATSVDDGFGAFGYKIEVPAYASTTSFDITATKDILSEGTETLRFKLTSTDNGNGRILNDVQYINLTVANYVSDEPVLSINFDKTVSYRTIERNIIATDLDDELVNHSESGCDLADFDFYAGSFFAFTGDCPETISNAAAATGGGAVSAPGFALADGDYPLDVDLWSLDLGLDDDPADGVNEVLDGDVPLPFTLEVNHVGTFNAKIEFPSLYFTNTATSATGGNGFRTLGTLRVTGGKYSLLDADGNLVAAE